MKHARLAMIAAVLTAALGFGTPVSAGDAPAGGATAPTVDAAAGPFERHHRDHPSYSLGPVDPARADKVRAINADCLSCHSDAGVKAPPRAGMDLGRLATLTVSAGDFNKSVHAAQACTNCHGDAAATYPHGADIKAATKNCVACHPRAERTIVPAFEDSRHFLRHRQDFTCASCHDAHTMVKASALGSPRAVAAQDNAACLGCHRAQGKPPLASAGTMPDLDLHHAWLPSADLHFSAVRCIDCHVEATEAGYTHRFVRITKANRDCASCHSGESALRTRLYRKALTGPQVTPAGYLNPAILDQAYVVGATRNILIDQAVIGLGALLLASLGLHGLFRFLVPAGVRKRVDALHGGHAPVYVFRLWIRVWHWCNVALMTALALSGVVLHFSRPITAAGSFALAHKIHAACGLALTAAIVLFLVGNALTGNWRQFMPAGSGLMGRLVRQARFYLWDIFRGGEHPFPITADRHFNPLQQIVYALVMYVACPVLVATGLLLLVPDVLTGRVMGMDALTLVATVHYVTAAAILLFTLSHIYLATTGGTVLSHLRSMITGWHRD